tara:strand:+ start:1379 stop:2656 length:1278 start_codon:yes stop_codon:yes gene_type:complete
MSKKYTFLLIFIFSLFILIYNFSNVRQYLKNNLPGNIKIYIKETFFGKKYIDEINTYRKQNYNLKLLPETQFENFVFSKIQLDNFEPTDQIHYGLIRGKGIQTKKFFIEPVENGLITLYHNGSINLIKNLETFDQTEVKTNLNSFYIKSVLDMSNINDNLFISYSFNEDINKECTYLGILEANINYEEMIFKKIFTTDQCLENTLGGRIHFYKHLGKDGFLFTTGASGKEKDLAQDDNSLYGKIIFFNLENYKKIIFSKGHRNPQGLTINNGIIISTEHGAYGGDEINKIIFNKNYGFPVSSYGDQYNFHEILDQRADYSFKKNHKGYNFQEPIFSFVPSIGISEIIRIPDSFSKYWLNNYLVSSLNGRSLYRIKFDEKFSKILFLEKIYIGERIRDIKFLKKNNSLILALEESGSIGVLKVQKK